MTRGLDVRRVLGRQLASLLGVRRVPSQDNDTGAPRQTFETLVRRHEDERHQRIIERLPSQGEPFPSRNPAGWRAEDFLGRADGFLPLATAADALGLSEAETIEACLRGFFEWDERGGSIYVQPAIVNVLGVTS